MRENMPFLKNLNLSGVTISAYTGKEGTANSYINGKIYKENEIPMYAFVNPITMLAKNSLSSIKLPNSATSIDQSAFWLCSGLTNVYIPPSITFIGLQAFELASGLIIVDPDNNNYSSLDGVLYDKTKSKLIHCPTSMNGAFTIPSSVSVVGRDAFGLCYGLTTITIPSSVISIETSAFSNCKNLIAIVTHALNPVNLVSSPGVFWAVEFNTCILVVPFGSSELYAAANQWQDFINIFELPEFRLSAFTATIPAIGGTASIDITTGLSWSATTDQTWITVNPVFGTGNQTLTFTTEANSLISMRTAKVTFEAPDAAPQTIVITQPGAPKVVNISAGGLSSALSAIELNSATRLNLMGTIDARDFKMMRDDMPVLAELDISNVTIAAYSGTLGTEGTGNITYEANSIPQFSFYNNVTNKGKTSLISVILPSSLKSIKRYSFGQCSGLTSLNIPGSVTSIESFAFNLCTGLISISVPSSVTTIGPYAFIGCSALTSVSIPASTINIQYEAFSECGSINVDGGNPNYSSIDGILFNKTKTQLIHFPVSKSGSYSIPSSVSSIALGAFRSCRNLTSVSIPKTVTSIESFAFLNCTGLESVYSNPISPVNLTSSNKVFYYVDKTLCILHVPQGSKAYYASSNQWKDFVNITEMPSFNLSAANINIASSEGSTATVNVTTGVSWSANSDKSWLSVNPGSGTGNNTLIFTAEANTLAAPRTAIVSVLGTEVGSQTIIVTQDGILTGLNKDEDFSIKIYPNPARDYLIVETGNYSETQNYKIEIFDQLGKIVFETKINQLQYTISLSFWSGKGVYFLKLYDRNKILISVKKIIVQ